MSELGQALKEAREQKELSLDDLQERTKIQKRYLKAIEDGDYKQLPGTFYIRAFIKSYAETVGLDFSALIQQYGSEIPTLHHDQPEIRTLPPSGAKPAQTARTSRSGSGEGRGGSVRLSSFINRALVVVIVLIILMVAYLLITGVMSNKGNNGTAGSPNSGSSVSFSGSSSSSDSSAASSDSGSTAGSSSSSSSVQQTLKKDSTQGTTSTYTLTGTQKFDVVVALKNGPKAWFEASDAKSGKVIKQGVVSTAGPKSVHINAANVQSLKLSFGAVPYTQLKINGQNFTFPSGNTVQNIVINYSK
ncbi:helix-turn-helix domain-containing protein [Sporolactobacillus vineae]|uniref:helix-turn-helix domain-containing protein n=1 Tax=Sporolactobacillus vineae TaxID=444463 RepID=UPI00028807D3|nr:helix-turn-helix domain-containing protein [Sporolactobacillus vineae]